MSFVIRIYGLVLNKNKQVLVTDEYQLGMKMTKFPGGGLDYGEGTIDCLRREFMEECNGQTISNIRHYFTTDYFQKALFYENTQLLSIYYLVDLEPPIRFKISTDAFDFQTLQNGNQSFRWLDIESTHIDMLSFPIDQVILKKLKADLSKR